MIFTVPQQPGVLLANVAYKFLVGGVEGPQQTTGITQPNVSFPFFVISAVPPAGTQEIIVYDVTNLGKWNVVGFLTAQSFYQIPSLPALNLTIPLIPGATLANLRYIWIANGIAGAPISTGITQPDVNFPNYLVSVVPPALAEEVILYDSTNLTNWNVGRYMLAAVTTLSFPLTPPPVFYRTVTLKSILNSILRRLGFDPDGDAITHDTHRAIVEHINQRVRYAFRYWEWPQLELIENRAFRNAFNVNVQYLRANPLNMGNGPDEVYYVDPLGITTGYYQVLTTALFDPPVGTLPTNTTYFVLLSPLTDQYILLDQVGQNPIGEVIEVYKFDPRLDVHYKGHTLHYHPTEREIRVTSSANLTVWVRFRLKYPRFTLNPYISTKTYGIGDLVYDYLTTGDCFKSLIANNNGNALTNSAVWSRVFFPEIFSDYVIAGAFASALREHDMALADAKVLQQRMSLTQAAESEALEYLTQEIIRLQAQGQTVRYPRFGYHHRHDWRDYLIPQIGVNAS